MQKVRDILLVLIFALNVFVVYKVSKPVENTHTNVDSTALETVIIKRDSIINRIDTVKVRIETNNHYYEKEIDSIIRNDITADYIYFRNYLNERFDSSNISN